MYYCDEQLSAPALENGLVYTRYADDITFSAGQDFSRQRADEVVTAAGKILQRQGFRPHRRKTKICPPGSRRIVLGLLVDGDHIRLSKDFRQQIETHIRGVERFGLSQHVHHCHFSSASSFVNHVNGLLAFASDIEIEYSNDQRRKWVEAMRRQDWPFPDTWDRTV